MRTFLLASAAVIAGAMAVAARGRIDLDESEIRADLRAGVTAVTIPVHNTTGVVQQAQLRLEWLNLENRTLTVWQRAVAIPAGASKTGIPCPLPLMKSNDQVYLRLRYTLSPMGAASRSFSTLTGIVALTAIAPHAFVLRIARIDSPQPGTDYIIRAMAVHPGTSMLTAGVKFAALLSTDKSNLSPSRAFSDTPGSMVFTFSLPREASRNEFRLRTQAQLGDYQQATEANLDVEDRPSARIETDKRLYQPGQTVHMRAIVLNGAGRAAEHKRVHIELRGVKGNVIREAHVTASRYGVVHYDFELPPTAELGLYNINMETDEDHSELGGDLVTVSRYELPAFTVGAKPDRPYYLPGQDALIDVSATYLFGKPVPRAEVRLTKASIVNPALSSERIATGDADNSGHFRARVPLEAEHANLQTRYRDVRLEAYCTDPESGRTEQLRFDLRITREPIHVYVSNSEQRSGPLPVPVYVSTWYADGAPAETEAQVRFGAQLTTVRTSRFGFAKVLLTPADGQIQVDAADATGLRGHWDEDIAFETEPALRVQSDKSIYQQGEAIGLTIEAPDTVLDVAVNVVSQGRTVESRHARLDKGIARLEFPYRPEFRRLVTFTVYAGDERQGHRAVVFPDGATLRLAATPGHAEYRPGENASMSLVVTAGAGQSPQSVLGVAIVDQAVAERAKTDAQFGQSAWAGCVNVGCMPFEPGGLTLDALYGLDLSQPLPGGLDLAAEALLASQHTPLEIESSAYAVSERTFGSIIEKQFVELIEALDQDYAQTLSYPRDAAGVARILAAAGLPTEEPRDPWGTRYALDFATNRYSDVLRFQSAGPDKKFGTADDFTAHEIRRSLFRPHEIAIEQALRRWGKCATGMEEIREALAANGVLLEAIKDQWGTPYKVRLENVGIARKLVFDSAGPDRKFGTADDTEVDSRGDSINVPCPVASEAAIRKALETAKAFPAHEQEFRSLLAAAGIDTKSLLDPWGTPFSVVVNDSANWREYGHPLRIYAGLGAQRADPVVEHQVAITLRSAGDPSKPEKPIPFDAIEFVGFLDPVPLGPPAGSGALCGEVRLQVAILRSSVSMAGVSFELRRKPGSTLGPDYRTSSDASGSYCFRGVSPGRYALLVTRTGYHAAEITGVPIADGHTTELNVGLQREETFLFRKRLGAGVLGGINTMSSAFGVAGGIGGGISTPRVRDNFPETLLWAPEVETDSQGRASLNFKLADNITNWRLTATASTPDGRLAHGSADIRAFQPFFVDLNPPPVLTVGDRVDLPVPVRNYLDQSQSVAVELQNDQWFEAAGATRREANVPTNASQTVLFPLTARLPIDTGHLRVVAASSGATDAIDKTVRVHPDGQETTQSSGDLVSGRTALTLNIPTGAIAGAPRGELRIYADPLAMLRDAIEGMLSRPYGCAEQTTSAGESNLVALRFARSMSFRNAAFEKQAIRNLELTRDRLAAYRAAGGGVTYWGSGPPDLGVSAYALRFLTEASAFIQVDPKLIEATATWLLKQRRADELWGPGIERAWPTTAVVVRGLAAARRQNPKLPAPGIGAIYRALGGQYAHPDPYVVAQLALAAMDLGDAVTAAKAMVTLKESVHEDAGGTYWQTPETAFGGWGSPATVEATALAVEALARWRRTHPAEISLDQLTRRGILYLLRNRDRYGVWYSTQATVAVMQAVASTNQVASGTIRTGKVSIVVNHRPLKDVTVSSGGALRLDVSSYLQSGPNQIELIPEPGLPSMITVALATHWLPWESASPRTSADLQYKVAFDRTEARPGESIECAVEARRSKGFGMLLAEIGLPPGAEVDRFSIEQALHNADSRLYRYDVLPDRLVLYLWPDDAGSSLKFRFRPRFAMEAKSAPSVLYDYYNPEAMTEAAPVLFHVR